MDTTQELTDYSIIVPSSRLGLLIETCDHLVAIGESPYGKNGTGYPSFSKLINECVYECPTEIIILCNDKARPEKEHIQKTLDLIRDGYGFVGLYCFGFFGFKKELYRKIGPLDERYVGGNYEDCDYIRRLNENNISAYLSYEIPYLESVKSGWNKWGSLNHYNNKWDNSRVEEGVCIRLLPEETYDYDFGPSKNDVFLPWSDTYIQVGDWFKNVEIKNINEN